MLSVITRRVRRQILAASAPAYWPKFEIAFDPHPPHALQRLAHIGVKASQGYDGGALGQTANPVQWYRVSGRFVPVYSGQHTAERQEPCVFLPDGTCATASRVAWACAVCAAVEERQRQTFPEQVPAGKVSRLLPQCHQQKTVIDTNV